MLSEDSGQGASLVRWSKSLPFPVLTNRRPMGYLYLVHLPLIMNCFPASRSEKLLSMRAAVCRTEELPGHLQEKSLLTFALE